MQKKYISLGLMSGTSGDGVDASIINSNGVDEYEEIQNKYYEYDTKTYKEIHALKERVLNVGDLNKLSSEIKDLERKITIFHAKVIKELELISNNTIIGFHGQTIYHNAQEKVSKQLGDARLLNQLTKKKIVFNFRKNDILNGGEGAPLAPVFHQLIVCKKKIKTPVCILNIGGIANITLVKKPFGFEEIFSRDIGPGNCLVDNWVRKNSNDKFDYDGKLASLGKKNEVIFEQAQELFNNRRNKDQKSFDINDFDISFVRGLSLEDGAATLTEFTVSIIGESLLEVLNKEKDLKDIILCGGGRKNSILKSLLSKYLPKNIFIKTIDQFGINGDFIESQAFAFLAIRTLKGLPITFPNTTNCNSPSTGGEIIKN